MQLRVVTFVQSFALIAVLVGCGGGGGGGGPVTSSPPSLSGAFPVLLRSGVFTHVFVTGSGLGSPGTPATIRYHALSGTPFAHGTEGTLSVPASVVADDEVAADTVAIGFGGTFVCSVDVVLSDGTVVSLGSPSVTLVGVDVETAEPSEGLTIAPTAFSLGGDGFEPLGGTATVRFHGAGRFVETTGHVVSATQITGTCPPFRSGSDVHASPEVILQNGARMHAIQPEASIHLRGRTELMATDPEGGDEFGTSVGIYGGTVVAGTPALLGGHPHGAAYVFTPSASGAWARQALVPNTTTGTYVFGHGVAIDGNVIAVAGRDVEKQLGFVFSLVGGSWIQTDALVTPMSVGGAYGECVAVSGSRIVVGYVGGGAHVFHFDGSTWVHEQYLMPPTAGEGIGSRVDIDGDRIVCSDPGRGVYVFERGMGEWLETAFLEEPGLVHSDQFGHSVSISGGVVAIGAVNKAPHGVVYVFEYATGVWTRTAALSSGVNSEFGFSVGINEGVLAAGNRRSVWVFRRDPMTASWGTPREFGSQSLVTQSFGASVAIHDEVMVVGAPLSDMIGMDEGAVYCIDVTSP